MSWAAERLIFDELGAQLEEAYGGPPEMGLFATELASLGRPVFPLTGKVPRIPNAHRGVTPGSPKASEEIASIAPCKGECGRDGHGLWDATTDQAKIDAWWTSWPNANIGVAIPAGVLVVDIDPRSGGVHTLERLTQQWGGFVPHTLASQTGGDSFGRHFYFAWDGPLRKVKRGELPGIDFKRQGGYVVAPPSVHPDTGNPYVWLTSVRQRVGPPPPWLARILTPVEEPPLEQRIDRLEERSLATNTQAGIDSIADWYGENHYWEAVLEPHGWNLQSGDGETNGSVWHAPGKSTKRSATIRHGTLFVWSTSTPFEPSNAGDPQGYTKFHAYAVLNHHGDRKAAARELWEKRKSTTR